MSAFEKSALMVVAWKEGQGRWRLICEIENISITKQNMHSWCERKENLSVPFQKWSSPILGVWCTKSEMKDFEFYSVVNTKTVRKRNRNLKQYLMFCYVSLRCYRIVWPWREGLQLPYPWAITLERGWLWPSWPWKTSTALCSPSMRSGRWG